MIGLSKAHTPNHTAMKTIATLIIAAALALPGCRGISEAQLSELRNQVSWQAFCAATGHSTDDNTFATLNDWMDGWIGSAAEEQAFINAGVQPY